MLRRAWRRLVGEWKTLVEKPVSSAEMNEAMQQASIPYFGFYLMLGLAAVIATFGLLSDSSPAIIGAMIIAPLMAPIISLSYAVVANDGQLAGRSMVTMVTGYGSGDWSGICRDRGARAACRRFGDPEPDLPDPSGSWHRHGVGCRRGLRVLPAKHHEHDRRCGDRG
ncbi:MAG: DUF389 domain-containing protein, partial [Pseudomonadota bacterium]|nr:DUF389 domain-containing protein [Pseudomonadota bacterium]